MLVYNIYKNSYILDQDNEEFQYEIHLGTTLTLDEAKKLIKAKKNEFYLGGSVISCDVESQEKTTIFAICADGEDEDLKLFLKTITYEEL